MICEYGCGQEAKYPPGKRRLKWCCNKNAVSCPSVGEKISKKLKNKPKSKETRKKMSDSKKGLQVGPKNPAWKGGYDSKNIPRYNAYKNKLFPIEKTRRNKYDKHILEVRCTYCGSWFIPTRTQIYERIRALNGNQGENRLYCSDKCKLECSIYAQKKYPKGFKPAASREVQPELRQMRFEIDNYTCQKCNKHQDELEVGLHCHHIEGIRWEPLESADVDKTITYCKTCHRKVHKKEGCTYNDLKCKGELIS